MKIMKRLTKTTVLLISLSTGFLVAGCLDGIPRTQNWPLQQPEASYEVDAWGTNPDLLEFTPKGNPDYFCILAVSGSDELKSIFCMPKKNAQIE